MGLDTTHDCWHGPYSSFGDWRKALAEAAGLPPLDDMEGFGGDILWTILKDRPLYLLINHSDCEGTLKASDCAAIADDLETLLPKLSDSGHYGGHKKDAERFIAGLRKAAAAGEDVEFR
jgi:hypothetical protein